MLKPVSQLDARSRGAERATSPQCTQRPSVVAGQQGQGPVARTPRVSEHAGSAPPRRRHLANQTQLGGRSLQAWYEQSEITDVCAGQHGSLSQYYDIYFRGFPNPLKVVENDGFQRNVFRRLERHPPFFVGLRPQCGPSGLGRTAVTGP